MSDVPDLVSVLTDNSDRVADLIEENSQMSREQVEELVEKLPELDPSYGDEED